MEMGGEDDRRERRIARRDRTKSPHHRHNDSNDIEVEEAGLIDASARRKSAANFSASKLVSNLKESQETTISRLRRVASTDGMARAAGEARRRPISRTMSAQASRRPGVERRLRAADTDVLSQSLGDNLGDDDMDHSNMGGSQTSRRRTPQRTKSTDSGLPRGSTGRVPRARRRPAPSDREEATKNLSSEQPHRRRLPARSKSADAFPPTGRGMTRPSRPGRRRNQAPDDEEDVIISDSDEEKQDDDDNNIDKSSRRRGAPPRSRSSHDGPTRGGHRNHRPTRRRPSGDSADASPKRSSGPGLQRSMTGTPTPSKTGPGLMRSHTSTNPRSNRTRGGRNTARELAQVAREKEKSPEASIEGFDDHPSSQHQSMSPVKSRQERRRLREGKELEAVERRTQGQELEDEEEEEHVVLEPEKKEAPWMRRLKKNVEDRAADDPFVTLGGETSTHTVGNKGSSVSRLDEHAFAVDPTFGVFPDMALDDGFNINDDDGTAHLSIAGGNKLDFSTIS